MLYLDRVTRLIHLRCNQDRLKIVVLKLSFQVACAHRIALCLVLFNFRFPDLFSMWMANREPLSGSLKISRMSVSDSNVVRGSGPISPRAFKLSLRRRYTQSISARGVLLIDRGLEALIPLMKNKNFVVLAMPVLDEKEIINPSRENSEIGVLLSQRVVVTHRAEMFREAAGVHGFSIIDTSERPEITGRDRGFDMRCRATASGF
jgi:hypothetical protein